jgi:hypothetical protein
MKSLCRMERVGKVSEKEKACFHRIMLRSNSPWYSFSLRRVSCSFVRFTSRTEQIGPIPLGGDHDKAQRLYTVYQNLVIKYKEQNLILEALWLELWHNFVDQTEWKSTSRIMAALPTNMSKEVHQVLGQLGVKLYKAQDIRRSPEWLQENGVCVDHMRIQESTLPQAGHGAFANRLLSKDSVILPVPLIHIPDRTVLNMYRIITRNEMDRFGHSQTIREVDRSKIQGYQLLLNYCLGHEESSLLLSPYGTSFSAINHNQTLANVRLQWADPKRSNHDPDLLQRSVTSLYQVKHASLAMELVALRDIQPHEEIFLDYGDAWESAWQQHLAEWRPAPGAETYVSAEMLNQNVTSTTHRLLTEFEQMNTPYPDNVALQCDIVDRDGSESLDCEIMSWDIDGKKGEILYTVVVPCNKVTARKEAKFKVVKNVRRGDISFFDRPYTSDMLLPNAFRHDIRLPDHMLPEAWKNLKRTGTAAPT